MNKFNLFINNLLNPKPEVTTGSHWVGPLGRVIVVEVTNQLVRIRNTVGIHQLVPMSRFTQEYTKVGSPGPM